MVAGAPDDTNSEKTYTNPLSCASRFYLDPQGNLRCFYTSSSGGGSDKKKFYCSYVYYLSDAQYVKTEALQRVLANFSTKLAENSPSSRISALRFSTQEYKSAAEGLKSLILLVGQMILSRLRRGCLRCEVMASQAQPKVFKRARRA